MTLEEYIALMDGVRQLTEAEVAGFEETLPASLPEDYREFLKKTNGGRISLEHDLRTPVASNGYGGFMGPLVVFGIDGKHSFQEEMRCFSGGIPTELLVIASDCFGNGICIGISGDARGKVYFWDHELEGQNEEDWDGSVETCQATTLHASSFAEYIAGSYIDDDEI